jgi:drug/metabolite transporter (DMT)-like permease
VIYGMLGQAAFNGLWAYSVQYNGAAVATVLAYTAPAFTVLLARPLLREPWTLRKAAAVALSLAGCALVARAYRADAWQLNLPGILTGVGTGLFYAIFSLLGRWGTQRFPNPLTVTTYGFLFAAIALGLTQNERTLFSLGGDWNGWGVLLTLAVGPTLMGYGMYTASLRYLPAGVAGLIASLEPALTALLAILILSEWLGGLQWLGVALILAAVVLVQAEVKPGTIPVAGVALGAAEAEPAAARRVRP